MTKTDDGISRLRRQIELLHQYRTRLIADVVTGKLDVREAAAALPEKLDDQDVVEGNFAEPDGRDQVDTGHSRRTDFPAAHEEMIA